MKQRALKFGRKPDGKIGILRDDGIVDVPDDPIEALKFEMRATLADRQRELDIVTLERERLKLEHARLSATKDHMARKLNFSFDPAVAASISPGAHVMLAHVEALLKQRGHARTDVSLRRIALLQAMREHPDVNISAADVAHVISGAATNEGTSRHPSPLDLAPVSPPGGRQYPVGDVPSQRPLRNQNQHAYRLSEDDVRATAQDASDAELAIAFAEAGAPNIGRASAGQVAAALGSGARVKRFLELARTFKLRVTNDQDRLHCEALLFKDCGSTVANAITATEALHCIAFERGWNLSVEPSRRRDAAIELAQRRPDLVEYGSRKAPQTEPETLQLSEAEKAETFNEAVVEEIVRMGLDPWDATSRREATERLLVTRPELVPNYRGRR